MIFSAQLFDSVFRDLQLSVGEPRRRRSADPRSGAGKGPIATANCCASSSSSWSRPVDTHLHADHVTGLGELREPHPTASPSWASRARPTWCRWRVADGDRVTIEGLALDVMYTPGHTDDSYSYLMGDRVFTRRYAVDPRHRPAPISRTAARGRSMIRSSAGCSSCRTRRWCFPAHDYKGRYRLHHRRGEALQSAPSSCARSTNMSS